MKFEFTTEEANIILNAVAQLPYNTAKPIVEKLLTQAQSSENVEETKEDDVEE